MPVQSKAKGKPQTAVTTEQVKAELAKDKEPEPKEPPVEPTEATIEKGKSLAGFPIERVEGMQTYINFLVYGEPGVGKTVLCGSSAAVAEMSPVLFIDVEGGTMPLRTLYPSVEVIRVKSFRDLQKLYNELYKGSHGYKTVVLDSLTELQKLSMQGIMKEAKRQNPDLSEETPRIQDWGTNLGQTRAMIRGFRDLPMNVIFTALNDEGEKNGLTTNRPLFQGKLKSEGPGFVDIVAYYYIKRRGEVEGRYLLTQATNTTLAKDRSTKLPKVMEDPTMADIFSTIIQNNNEA